MPPYRIQEGDRLDLLCERTYGVQNDAALLTVALANQATWTGGLPEVGTLIELPAVLRTDITRIPSPFSDPAPSAPTTGDESADWTSGGLLDTNEQAIKQAILTRALTIAGSRPYSIDIGSQAIPLALTASSEADYPSIIATIGAALAKDADWYEMDRIEVSRSGENLRIIIYAIATADGTPVRVEIGLG